MNCGSFGDCVRFCYFYPVFSRLKVGGIDDVFFSCWFLRCRLWRLMKELVHARVSRSGVAPFGGSFFFSSSDSKSRSNSADFGEFADKVIENSS